VARGQLEALMEVLPTTKSIDELQVWTHELRDRLGVTHILYHTVNQKGEQTGIYTYSHEWAARYAEKKYYTVDPVVLGSIRRSHPIDWKMLDWSSSQSREFLRDAMKHGIGSQGWSIPIWGPHGEFALFVVNHETDDDRWDKFTRSHARDLLLISHLVHQQAMRLINRGQVHAQSRKGSAADFPPRSPAGYAPDKPRGYGTDARVVAAGEGGIDASEPWPWSGTSCKRTQHLRKHASRLHRLR
jgi:hypothetical protein